MSQVIDLTATEEFVDISSDGDEESSFAGFEQDQIDVDLISDDEDSGDELTLIEGSQRARYGGVECAQGQTIEFDDDTFMSIRSVIRATEKTVVLEGMVLKRQNTFAFNRHLPDTELVYFKDLTRHVHSSHIRRTRMLVFTNHKYPSIPEQYSDNPQPDIQVNSDLDILFCRWRLQETYLKKRLVGQSWLALDETEANTSARISDSLKRNRFREVLTVRGGSHIEDQVLVHEDGYYQLASNHRYTFADSFCGAGGASMGAHLAGLKIRWSFDHDKDAINTYQLNFPTAAASVLDAFQFLLLAASKNVHMVDILHISPPCQPFSPAHTTSWTPESIRRDEENQAAMFAVPELIRTIKPRIVTVEETVGLVNRHKEYFDLLIHFFIDAAFSVRWQVLKCSDYGVPQLTRYRLVIIAAGPGEALPDFPAPTHSPNQYTPGDLLRSPTIHQCINNIGPDENGHVRSGIVPKPQPPFDPHSYANTITCNSGVGNYHPSGLRHYTPRELARLQTFPPWFQFAPSDEGGFEGMITKHKRQVGNAVPPLLGRAIFQSIIESLERTDYDNGANNPIIL